MARRNLGMKLLDERWVLTDQLIQLKGVVEFNERSERWLDLKGDLSTKIYDNKIRQVSQNVKRLRALVKKYEFGYVDELNDVLQKDKEVYLMCRKKPPDEIIENLKHMIFRQRKAVDKINNEINSTKKDLFEVELNIAALKDKVNSGQQLVKDKLREENEKYSAAMEYASTQNDICNIVLECYKKIIGVLQRDSFYFDEVINSLKNDATIQSQTILKIIELGQLACEDFAWLKQQAKKSAVKFNMEIEDHRREIKAYAEEIRTLGKIEAKLNEYAAKAYPMFQEEDKEEEIDEEVEQYKKQYEEAEKAFGKMQSILGVNSVPEVFSEMQKLKTTIFELDKFIEELAKKRDDQKVEYLHAKALEEHLEQYIPVEANRFIKEEQMYRSEIDAMAATIQKMKVVRDKIKESIDNDKQYFYDMRRLLWLVDIGEPECTDETGEDADSGMDSVKEFLKKKDPFDLFNDDDDKKTASSQNKEVKPPDSDVSSVCEDDPDDIPFRLMELVRMKAQVLHDSIGDRGTEDDPDPKILEAFGDTIAEEQAAREESLQKLMENEKIVIRKYKPKYEDHINQTCDKKTRLELKFMSRQLVVDNETSKEKGEIRYHMHPTGVYRGMYIEVGSSEESSEPEEEAKKKEEQKETEDEEEVDEEESDIGYEPSEEEQLDSDLEPNQPKPHICY